MNTNNLPLISVVIPTWNRANLTLKAIDSACKQISSFPFEIIVVDDGSTDCTLDLLNKTYDGKIRVVHQVNIGVSSARNLGVKEAKGEFIAFLDSDDLMLPERLQQQAQFLQNHPSCGLVASNYKTFSSEDDIASAPHFDHSPFGIPRNGTGIVKEYFVASVSVGNPLFNTAMVRKRVFDATGGFDSTLDRAEDFELSARFAAISDIGIIDAPLIGFRDANHNRLSNTVSTLHSGPSACYEAMIDVWLKKHIELIEKTPGFREHVSRWCSALTMQHWGNRNTTEMGRIIRKYWHHMVPKYKLKAILCLIQLVLLKPFSKLS